MDKIKLKLYFKDDNKASKTISIDYPKADYREEDIIEAMDNILYSNVLVTKNGLLTEKDKAELETVRREAYQI